MKEESEQKPAVGTPCPDSFFWLKDQIMNLDIYSWKRSRIVTHHQPKMRTHQFIWEQVAKK
jgi:hypothetical protein